MSTALLTDHYELTMLAAALRDGTAELPAAFEVFARQLPEGRRYGVVGGIGRLHEAITAFRFGDAELAFLADRRFLDDRTLAWLAGFRFGGDVVAYREGELWFPSSPIATIEGTFAEAIVLETLVLSILNHDSAVAAAVARMVDAAAGRQLIEMGGRRAHEEAAVAAARVAHLLGFASSSNLEAGRRYGVPTAGTAAHAFTLAHRAERDAFASQLDALGLGTTLLVDTYDVDGAVRLGVALANERGAPGPGAVRLDSGELGEEAFRVRALLDGLGATATRIVASGDLDEFAIAALAERGAPVDVLGVGTSVVTGSGHPTAGFVYKLVAIGDEPGGPLRPVAKLSVAKVGAGGRKRARRLLDGDGRAAAELVDPVDAALRDAIGEPGPGRALQVLVVDGGEPAPVPSVDGVRRHHRLALDELSPADRSTGPGPPVLTAQPTP